MALGKLKLQALIVRTHEGDNENVFYLSGFSGTTAVLLITRKHAYIVVDARYYLRATSEASHFRMVRLARGGKLSDEINAILEKVGVKRGSRIGFEAAHLPVQVAESWKGSLKAKLVPTVHLVEKFRQVKDSRELAALSKACRLTSGVFKAVVPLIKPGMTEADLAFEIDMRLRLSGAAGNSFPTIVASGPNSAVPHHATGRRRLRQGEPVVMDFGGVFPGGYCSDITRTIFVPGRQPDPELVDVYRVVLGANEAARKALRPGVMWRDYDMVARDYIAERGYGKYFTHGLGHSLGLVAHDPYDYENDAFQEGAVLTDEPGIYIEGLGGVRIEDDLVVTANGAERLTNAPYLKL